MKKFYLVLLIAIILSQLSCNGVETKKRSTKAKAITSVVSDSLLDRSFTFDPTLTKDFMTWYNYTYYNIRLSQDFIGLDIDSKKIDKATFLNKFLTDNVVAFKTKILRGQSVYQLFKLNSKLRFLD